jgi:hypothetical protein
MKLGDALGQRAECEARLEDLKKRLVRNACLPDGEAPAEDPQGLLDDVDRTALRLVELVQTIRRTATSTRFDEGSLADAMAERDVLGRKRDLLIVVAEAATADQHLGRPEVRMLPTIQVARIHRHVDQLSKRYREIDARIQELCWRTDVM